MFHLSMDCFWCEIVKGNLVLEEHEAARWLSEEQLDEVEWLPADVTLIAVSYTHLGGIFFKNHRSYLRKNYDS